jgi:hypothetical protein
LQHKKNTEGAQYTPLLPAAAIAAKKTHEGHEHTRGIMMHFRGIVANQKVNEGAMAPHLLLSIIGFAIRNTHTQTTRTIYIYIYKPEK